VCERKRKEKKVVMAPHPPLPYCYTFVFGGFYLGYSGESSGVMRRVEREGRLHGDVAYITCRGLQEKFPAFRGRDPKIWHLPIPKGRG